MEAFTARNVTKYVARVIIQTQVANTTATLITDHTQFEEDDLTVRISSAVVGWGVADKLQPVTNKMVDTVADFVADKRANRAAKKNTTEEK